MGWTTKNMTLSLRTIILLYVGLGGRHLLLALLVTLVRWVRPPLLPPHTHQPCVIYVCMAWGIRGWYVASTRRGVFAYVPRTSCTYNSVAMTCKFAQQSCHTYWTKNTVVGLSSLLRSDRLWCQQVRAVRAEILPHRIDLTKKREQTSRFV